MPNRLAAESSPYLRQHADNPVGWYPWGDVAISEANVRDVPIDYGENTTLIHEMQTAAATATVTDD